MQIHIDTATDDLPAVIRMLQALNAGQDTRLDEIKDAVEKHAMGVRQRVVVELPNGDNATYSAPIPPCSAHADEPDPAAHCYTLPNGDCVSEDPRCMHQPTPEEVFAAPKSLFDAPLPPASQTLKVGEATGVPRTAISDVTVDAAGLPWDARIHSGAKTKLANGNWKLLRGVDPALVASVEAELRGDPKPAGVATGPSSAPVPPAPPVAPPTTAAAVAPPVSPPPPPAPLPIPPAPKPITNAAQLVAAVMDKRFTTDQVNAACQAVGVENVASLLAKQDKLPEVLRHLGVPA